MAAACVTLTLGFQGVAGLAQALVLQEVEHRDPQRLPEMALQRGGRGIHVARDLVDAQGLVGVAAQPVGQVHHAAEGRRAQRRGIGRTGGLFIAM